MIVFLSTSRDPSRASGNAAHPSIHPMVFGIDIAEYGRRRVSETDHYRRWLSRSMCSVVVMARLHTTASRLLDVIDLLGMSTAEEHDPAQYVDDLARISCVLRPVNYLMSIEPEEYPRRPNNGIATDASTVAFNPVLWIGLPQKSTEQHPRARLGLRAAGFAIQLDCRLAPASVATRDHAVGFNPRQVLYAALESTRHSDAAVGNIIDGWMAQADASTRSSPHIRAASPLSRPYARLEPRHVAVPEQSVPWSDAVSHAHDLPLCASLRHKPDLIVHPYGLGKTLSPMLLRLWRNSQSGHTAHARYLGDAFHDCFDKYAAPFSTTGLNRLSGAERPEFRPAPLLVVDRNGHLVIVGGYRASLPCHRRQRGARPALGPRVPSPGAKLLPTEFHFVVCCDSLSSGQLAPAQTNRLGGEYRTPARCLKIMARYPTAATGSASSHGGLHVGFSILCSRTTSTSRCDTRSRHPDQQRHVTQAALQALRSARSVSTVTTHQAGPSRRRWQSYRQPLRCVLAAKDGDCREPGWRLPRSIPQPTAPVAGGRRFTASVPMSPDRSRDTEGLSATRPSQRCHSKHARHRSAACQPAGNYPRRSSHGLDHGTVALRSDSRALSSNNLLQASCGQQLVWLH